MAPRPITLDQLFDGLATHDRAVALGHVHVTGLSADSRAIGLGMVFAALKGAKADGAAFAAKAVTQGAVAILTDETTQLPELAVPIFRSPEPRRTLALAAHRLHPGQPHVTVAITGTSGKSSVADFTRQLFAGLGHAAASVGTIGVVKAQGSVYGALTTPDPVTLHATLDGLEAEGITHLAFEASSHGLDQHRVDGVTLAAGAFLNLGRDHLDYHPTIEAYLTAKLRLFNDLLAPGQPVVINADGPFADRAMAAARARGLTLFTTGRAGDDIRLIRAEPVGFTQHLTLRARGIETEVELPLVGTYQVENALVAAGLAIVTGAEPASVLPLLTKLQGVKGRLEVVAAHNGGLVVVDYAHKPDALEAVLLALRPFASGKLICVFGCGGDRDRGKRPLMGAIAVARADVTIVTDDNPRTEVPSTIRGEILSAAPGARDMGDRRLAIETAMGLMAPGDVLVVAGKGHETGQIVGGITQPFSDHDVIRDTVRKIGVCQAGGLQS